jgi:hypothetical protein
MTDTDRREYHSFANTVQYYDATQGSWVQTDVPAVRWFDARDSFRESLETTRDQLRAKVEARLARLEQRAREEPTAKRVEEYRSYETYTRGQFQVYLRAFDDKKASLRAYLEKLETTRDFAKAIFAIVRAAENRVRGTHGIAAVGEAWVSETELLYRVRRLFPDHEVIAHGSPRWLGQQHLDIWIPALRVAIEYQGIQHFQPVARFGGDAAFKRAQERDHRKRELCTKNSVRLLEVVYDRPVEDHDLRELVVGARRP